MRDVGLACIVATGYKCKIAQFQLCLINWAKILKCEFHAYVLFPPARIDAQFTWAMLKYQATGELGPKNWTAS